MPKDIMKDLLFEPVIEILKRNGATEDQIATILADFAQTTAVLLYKQALETFSDEDMQQIESAPNDDVANELIIVIYSQRIGSTPEEVMQTFLKKFVEKFIEEDTTS
jgi:hypothetical protein